MSRETSRDALRAALTGLYDRLARGALTPDDLLPEDAVTFETPPHWVADVLARRAVYEDDARILGRLRAEHGAILDIGAQWGFMALSFRHAGSDCPILSFEPLAAHRAALDAVRAADAAFDYRALGLGEAERQVRLLGPVVNGQPILGLNSVEATIYDRYHLEHLVSLLGGEIPEAQSYEVRLHAVMITTRRLDSVLAEPRPSRLDLARVAALKLDVEGHEAPVLEGALATLRAHRPLLMVESGNRTPAVAALLAREGYAYAEREGLRLVPTDRHTSAPNGFWHAPERRALYASLGLF